MEEECFIHMDSKRKEDHLDTVAMLEAERTRSERTDYKSRNGDKNEEKVIMNLQAWQLLGHDSQRERGTAIL